MTESEAGTGRGQEKEKNRKDEGRSGTAAEYEASGKVPVQRKPKELSVGKAILMITQIGISMLAPIFVGGLIGHWLDRLTGAGFLFLIFLLFGFLAAFRNVYRLTKPFYADDLQREKQEQAYWRELEQERKKNRAIAAGRESSAGGGLQ
ncbi:MAG: AtpZ/AtpI family protein, partial [Lachnospiraceae bacterium]|nr:AtpZ/AtpI family protein [Lachnospiraceae bacterium]